MKDQPSEALIDRAKSLMYLMRGVGLDLIDHAITREHGYELMAAADKIATWIDGLEKCEL